MKAVVRPWRGGANGKFQAQPEGWTTSGVGYVVHASAWGIWVALPLRGLEADLIHPRGKPVGVWEM